MFALIVCLWVLFGRLIWVVVFDDLFHGVTWAVFILRFEVVVLEDLKFRLVFGGLWDGGFVC